jgi:hypothetical protein
VAASDASHGDSDRSVSSQATVVASNVRRVTPKPDSRGTTDLPRRPSDRPPRTVEELYRQMLRRDEQRRLIDQQLDRRMDRLVRQVNTLTQQVQALAGTVRGIQQQDSPAHRRDSAGECLCGFFSFRYRAHRHQAAVEPVI